MKILLPLLLVANLASAAEVAPAHRPWAVKVEKPGLPNFHRVGTGLYRGAQPADGGMKSLDALGIKTVIDLRAFHSDSRKIAGTKLDAARIQFKTWHPEDEDVVRFLKIATAPERQPVFVHCQHGSDRTGTMIAIYRIAVEGWTKQEAIDEMTHGGFGFHPVWKNLITYIEKVDVAALKRRAGISG